MTKFKATGVACLTVALAAAIPAMAQVGYGGGRPGGGFAQGGADHFTGRGGGLRGGFRRGGFGIAPDTPRGAVVGAIIGGGYGGSYDGPGYEYGPSYHDDSYANTGDQGFALDQWPIGNANNCAQRYRSYDPASGSYIGADGQRHLC
jgi:BA14K-like protein